MRSAPLALTLATCLLALPVPAAGGTEEFSTFDVVAQEEDDESLLDHLLTRPPLAWQSEWERAPQAVRTSQGCLTSGQWFISTQLKLVSPLGQRARFGLDVRQEESDIVSYQYFDFSFRFPTRWGTPGVMFRPLYDKSRQDLALTWESGTDTSAFQLQTIFSFEDTFNNLWAFRQTRVGNRSEPYERHPYEPGLRAVGRGAGWRTEIGGRYLTPSRKRIPVDPAGLERRTTLWGALAWGSVEARALGLAWELRAANRQASAGEAMSDGSAFGGDFRRQWSAEAAVRRQLSARLTAETRWLYQARSQTAEVVVGSSALEAVDRLLQLEGAWAIRPDLRATVGALYDRIAVARSGATSFVSYGSRTESRAYVGLSARFGRVSVHAVEGLELDPEPYEVWLIHDKAFLHLQTAF